MSDCGCGGTCGCGGAEHVTLDTTQVLELTADQGRSFAAGVAAGIESRLEAIEAAVKALAIQAFGDVDGHPFHGNQYSDGQGGKTEDFKPDGRLPGETARAARVRMSREERMKNDPKANADHTIATKYGFKHFGQSARDHNYELYTRNGRKVSEKQDPKPGDRGAVISIRGDQYHLEKTTLLNPRDNNGKTYESEPRETYDSLEQAIGAGLKFVKPTKN